MPGSSWMRAVYYLGLLLGAGLVFEHDPALMLASFAVLLTAGDCHAARS